MLEDKKRAAKEEDIDFLRLLSEKEVGEILGVSVSTVNRLVREGRMGCVQIRTRRRRFTKELVEEFIEAETLHRHPIWEERRGY